MLARLFLLLILVAFAAPSRAAAPACHDGPAPMAMTHHGMPPAPTKAEPAHVCVGCVPVGDWLAARIAAPVPPAAAAPEPRVARLDLGRRVPPALPPPRRA